jgi:hypothetical protein
MKTVSYWFNILDNISFDLIKQGAKVIYIYFFSKGFLFAYKKRFHFTIKFEGGSSVNNESFLNFTLDLSDLTRCHPRARRLIQSANFRFNPLQKYSGDISSIIPRFQQGTISLILARSVFLSSPSSIAALMTEAVETIPVSAANTSNAKNEAERAPAERKSRE